MTNIDRAAEVLWLPEPHLSTSECDDQSRELAHALATAGLLMPDLPEATHDGTWELPSGESIRVSRKGIQAGTTRTPAEARSYALALLAAANYAERNQE